MAHTDGELVAVLPPALAERSPLALSFAMWSRLFMLLALLHGLLYLIVVPPWQHYDEPTHFEYARFVALFGYQPGLDEVDLASNREIADSMYRFHFWPAGEQPQVFDVGSPNIGLNEKVHPPLYYALAALPIRALQHLPIEFQLYAARMVSVFLYVLIVVAAWRIAALLFPDRIDLCVAVLLILLLAPSFADQMSAVNNDALVNFGITALLLGCIWLIRDGLRPVPLLLALFALGVAVMAKRTALVGCVPLLMTLFWAWWRRPVRWWIYVVVAIVFPLLLILVVVDITAAGWTFRAWLVSLDQNYLRLGLEQMLSVVHQNFAAQQDYLPLIDMMVRSFWASFGWDNVRMAAAWEWSIRLIVISSCVGLLVAGIRPRSILELWRRRIFWLFGATVGLAWIAVAVRFITDPSGYVPRGRYAHMAIVPIAWLLVLGLLRLVPQKWHVVGLRLLVGFFFLMDTVAWAWTISNFYYR